MCGGGSGMTVFVLQEIGGLGEARGGGGAVVHRHMSPQSCCPGHVATLITPELEFFYI